MENLKDFGKRLVKEESAQGATEYILLLAIVVGLVMAFKGKITGKISGIIDTLSSKIDGAMQ